MTEARGVRRVMLTGTLLLTAAALSGCAGTTAGPARSSSSIGSSSTARPSAYPAAGSPTVRTAVSTWRVPAVSREVAVAVDGTHLAVLGGLHPGNASGGAVDLLDLAAGTVRNVGDLALPVHDAAAGVIGGRTIVVGGGAPATLAQVQEIRPAPAGPPNRSRVIARLPRPRSDATGVMDRGRLFVVGGYDGSAPTPTVLATTDGSTYVPVANLPVPVRYPAVAVLGARIYVIGGQATSGPNAGRATDAVQVIDPLRHSATLLASLPHPLTAACAVTVGDTVYVLGGRESSSPSATATATVARLDPRTGRLRSVATLGVPVSNAAAVAVGHTIWVIGGERGSTPLPYVQRIIVGN